MNTPQAHVPFRYAREIQVPTQDNVIIDYDEQAGQYVAFFSDSMVCRVKKTATFKSKADMDHYLQSFCHGKNVQYGKIRFVMRLGGRKVCSKDYTLSNWNPISAHADFVKHCMEKYPKQYATKKREIDSSYVL